MYMQGEKNRMSQLLCLTLCRINKILRFYATKQADEDATTTSGENLSYWSTDKQ